MDTGAGKKVKTFPVSRGKTVNLTSSQVRPLMTSKSEPTKNIAASDISKHDKSRLYTESSESKKKALNRALNSSITKENRIIQLKKKKTLGEGSYGSVYETVDGKAIKRCKIKDRGIENLLELNIMTSLKHPNINSSSLVYVNKRFILIEQEIASYDLRNYLKEKKLSTKTVVSIFHQICSGVYFLHSKNIIHADLKPANVLIYLPKKRGEINVKLTDFGMSRLYMGESLNKKYGSPTFIAPEYYVYNQWDKSSDIWSLGIILYMMVNGKNIFPFQDTDKGFINAFNTFAQRTNQEPLDYSILEDVLSRDISFDENTSFRDDILSILRIDHNERPTIAAVLDLPMFNGLSYSLSSHKKIDEVAIFSHIKQKADIFKTEKPEDVNEVSNIITDKLVNINMKKIPENLIDLEIQVSSLMNFNFLNF